MKHSEDIASVSVKSVEDLWLYELKRRFLELRADTNMNSYSPLKFEISMILYRYCDAIEVYFHLEMEANSTFILNI